MKKLLVALALLIGYSATASAQDDTLRSEKKYHKTVKKTRITKTKKVTKYPNMTMEGVMMKNNQMMRCHDKQWTLLSETYTCDNGTKVMTDGDVLRTDGSKMRLSNGQGFHSDGKMIDKTK